VSHNEKPDKMARRQFVRISGVAGAASLMGLLRPSLGLAAPEHPPPCPPPGAPTPPGAPNCPPPAMATQCGSTSDTDPLWLDVQRCTGTTPPPSDCLRVTSTYVVRYGDPRNTHDFLLLPTCRVRGIECPFISTTSAPNYWSDAWDNARPGGQVPVIFPNIGLGVNSADRRRFDQLHIHMAGILSGVQGQLNAVDNMITRNTASWGSQIVQLTGLDRQFNPPALATRSYRALRVTLNDLMNDNLFRTLRNMVGQTQMGKQTLIVTPRNIGTRGFYVLNSQPDLVTPPGLPGGTGTCDLLLVYN
jgi:CDP-diacylglycerol pyrophosphatase